MKAKIIVAAASVILAATACTASGQAQPWACTPAGQKTQTAQLQSWLGNQSAGDAAALTRAQTWASQAEAACKARRQPPPPP